MTTYYVDYQNGSDANAGTGGWSDAFATNSKLLTLLASGDTAYFRGSFVASADPLAPDELDDVSLIGDPGHDADGEGHPWVSRGGVELAAGSWISVGSGVYYQSIGGGLTILGVTQDWDDTTREDVSLYHMGHLPEASDNTLADGNWYYDTGAGRLYVKEFDSGADPAGFTFEYLTKQHGLYASDCDSLLISGLCCKCHIWFGDGDAGYAVKLDRCNDSVVRDCDAQDCGDHPFGCTGLHTGNTLRRCRVYGQDHDGGRNLGGGGAERPQTPFVFAVTNTSSDGGQDTAIDCLVVLGALLEPDGTMLRAVDSWDITVFLSHQDASNLIDDVVWERCDIDWTVFNATASVDPYDPNARRISAGGHSGTLPSFTKTDETAYSARFIDCDFTIGGPGPMLSPGSASFTRCRFHLSSADYNATAFGPIYVAATSVIVTKMSYCTLAIDTRNGLDSTQGSIEVRDNSGSEERTMIFENCSFGIIRDDDAWASAANRHAGGLRFAGGLTNITFDRCLIVQSGAAGSETEDAPFFFSITNVDATGSEITMTDNWYVLLVNGTGALGNANADSYIRGNGTTAPHVSQATFESDIDSSGVYDIDPQLLGAWPISGPGDLEPVFAGALDGRRGLSRRPGKLGINGLPDSGLHGAYQYGGRANRGRGRGRARRISQEQAEGLH